MNKLLKGLLIVLLASAPALAAANKPLKIYFIDTEGGAATLFVSPSGESLLVDTGWPDQWTLACINNNNCPPPPYSYGRDAHRILAAARNAGIHQINYLVVTHYHADHVGGVPQLAALIPIRNFIDHGTPVQHDPLTNSLYHLYLQARAHGHHIVASPGMHIPITGMSVTVLAAAGKDITHALPGAGQPNPYCPEDVQPARDHSENAQSVGLLISYGRFRMIDLGDLPSWPGEHGLVCPDNLVGPVEVYLTTQHAYAESGAYFLVDALHPIAAIADNGAHKGGEPEALMTIHLSPGLEGFWDLHYSYAADKQLNAQVPFIANPTAKPDHGYWIKLTAYSDGRFIVANQRNGVTRTYQPR